MTKDNPGVLLILLVVVILEIGIIFNCDRKHYTEFTDAVVVLTMFAAAYFAYHYIKARRNLPVRGTDLKTSLSNYREYVAREGRIEENKLYDSEEYKRFEREK